MQVSASTKNETAVKEEVKWQGQGQKTTIICFLAVQRDRAQCNNLKTPK